MLDAALRARLAPALEAAARPLAARGVRATSVTAAGFAVGAGACVAAALALWALALALWLLNRALDGLDGALARLHGATDRGGFLDIVADLAVYGGFVAGVAVAVPGARLACAVLLASYYLNAGAWLAYSSLAERRRLAVGDDRSLRFVTGVAEGTETVVAYTLFCLLPAAAATIAWVFAVAVAATVLQRLVHAVRTL
jgi:phosphatidylglycerophosphate synthase